MTPSCPRPGRVPFVCRLWPLLLAAWLGACTTVTVSPDHPRTPSTALAVGTPTPLGDAVAALAAGEAPGRSGFRLLTRGPQALVARHAMVLAAQRTLDLQYYIVGDDATSADLIGLAAQAAARGVRVRLLVDDIHTDGRDRLAASLARHPNVEMRVFNPFGVRGTMGFWRTAEFLWDNDRLNRRMHNKAMIADNAVAVVGGRNLADEYFGSNAATAFVDLDLLAAGPVVAQLSEGFDAYWNSPYAIPVEAFVPDAPEPDHARLAAARPVAGAVPYADHLLAGTLPLQWGEARALWDLPEKVEGAAAAARDGVRIGPRIRRMILDAKRSVTLASAYLVPRQRGVDEFAALVDAGVRVRIVTNSLGANDVIAAHGGYAHYRPGLVQAGVALYELRPQEAADLPEPASGASNRFRSRTSLHAKAMVIDGDTVVVGSFNGDPRSVWLNTETAVVVRNVAMAQDLEAEVDTVIAERCHRVRWEDDHLVWERQEDGRTLRFDVEPDTSAWRRWLSRMVWAVTPEGSL